ncbi:GH36-type glycosyl hydrolase domain-containing protein [Fundicoccus culcitae]|uniref:Cellobiose phosphorylase n=1 Tax=Fundicoccus culcitae TaxID=2969821 RepID=A0ABY5P9H3_9LACT|nr:cellobiose phosphorylase [Fundicoccus culcitae]UUX35010.1 cellobiose phosphorylase [Fundicoccus culcitae]
MQNKYHMNEKVTLSNPTMEVQFKASGELFHIMSGQSMINQVETTNLDGSLNQIYLRIWEDGSVKSAYPLMGLASHSEFAVSDQQVTWHGQVEGITYDLYFQLSPQLSAWYWTINIAASKDVTVDFLYGQDIGLAAKGAIQSNEAYVSQYIDHKAINGPHGYVVCSRQNQPQHGHAFPYLQQGSFHPVGSYSTDGFQFFGTEYKFTNEAKVLKATALANEVLQYEFAYTGLLVEPITLKAKETETVVFYNYFEASHEAAITQLEFLDIIEADFASIKVAENFHVMPTIKAKGNAGELLIGEPLTAAELKAWYPSQTLIEKDGQDQVLSFFTDEHAHVVLQAKEALMQRQHGQILFSKTEVTVDKPVISTTAWMDGIFNSQVVIGNTSMNKWITNTRNPLNILKASGQRIYIQLDEQWYLLAMPSVFEIGNHYVKWLYKIADDVIEVLTYTLADSNSIQLVLKSQANKAYPFLVTQQVIMNEAENRSGYDYEVDGQLIWFKAVEPAIIHHVLPALSFYLEISSQGAFFVTDESELLDGLSETGQEAEVFTLRLEETARFELTIQGTLDGADYVPVQTTFEATQLAFKDYFGDLTRHLTFDFGSENQTLTNKYNSITYWYTHNMLVHYLVPHGLEQYGGAAWGTRDVSQGPVEFFLATQHFDVVKDIVLKLYTHQFVEDGNWPQWFMFDQYAAIQAGESHGDIIVWPLKVVAEYLKATDDVSILEVELPYMSHASKAYTEEKETLLQHIQKQIAYITSHFLEGTYLSSYGDGDWDDTLQPYNERLKSHMASSWTVELTYQALMMFADALDGHNSETAELVYELAAAIRSDINKYILADDVVPGFVYQTESGEFTYMIHPSDENSDIDYRLLPMIQGMTSELFSKDQAEAHFNIIEEHLLFTDGAHLMNQPATYKGGVSTNYKRAEQASTFGREIGLQYVHAHIRFVEAMAKMGKNELSFEGLETINPILIQEKVPNALTRQSNAYFSSSDAQFNDRYIAQENFKRLKNGEVPVMGGWRIYSSGPGIYLNQLISNVLGIRIVGQGLVLDPVLSGDRDGLKIQFAYGDVPVQFAFHAVEGGLAVTVNDADVVVETLENPYRAGGLYLSKEVLDSVLVADGENRMDIYFPQY